MHFFRLGRDRDSKKLRHRGHLPEIVINETESPINDTRFKGNF